MTVEELYKMAIRRFGAEAQEKADERGGLVCIDDEADYLLANGVIVPPCKVGDTVFFLHNGIELCEAMIINIEDNYYTNPQMWITVEFFSKVIGTNTYKNRIDLMLGKTVFLTKEEAERELRKRSEDNAEEKE